MASAIIDNLLERWSRGDRAAFEELVPLIYDELKQIAQRLLASERHAPTMSRTVLVHEAYMRLLEQNRMEWSGRAHFFGAAAQVMRRVLVEHARKRLAEKRGSGVANQPLDALLAVSAEPDLDALELHDALNALAEVDRESAQIVELRCFGGFSIEETADILQTSPSSVSRMWSFARAWLFRRLNGQDSQR